MEPEFNDWELLHDDSPESEAKQSRQLGGLIQSDYFCINSERKTGSESGAGRVESDGGSRSGSGLDWAAERGIGGSEVKREVGFVGNEELGIGLGEFGSFIVEGELGLVEKRENLVSFEGGEEFGLEGKAGGEVRSGLGKVGVEGGAEGSEEVSVVSGGLEKGEVVSRGFDGGSGLDGGREKSAIFSSGIDGQSGLKSEIVSSGFDGISGLGSVLENSEIVSSAFDHESGLGSVWEKSEVVSSEFDGTSGVGAAGGMEKSEIDLSGFDGKSESKGKKMESESVKSDKGGDVGANEMEETQGEMEKRRVVWWKVPLNFLKYCVFRVNPVLSFSVAAALMGAVLLSRRLYKMKQKSRSLEVKVILDDKKASQFISRAARLNEAFSVVRRVPVIRPSLPASGAAPWPAMSLR